jgi:hypothetical protein
MTEIHYDPNSLADRLDQLLPPGQPDRISSDGDPLIEAAARLAAAPRPALSPAALARIQAQAVQARPLPRRAPVRLPTSGRLALVAAVAVIVTAGAVFAAQQINTMLTAPTPTAPVTPLLTPTWTPSPTASLTVTPTQTPTATILETATPEALLNVPASPAVAVTPTLGEPLTLTPLPPALIIEGPIQVINGATIVVYDMTVQLNPNDPILSALQIGDVVRIEGDTAVNADSVIVAATSVVTVNVEVVVNEDGAVWRDQGDCGNPPPPWAPAHGWRRRCENPSGAVPGAHGSNGNNGSDDDDNGMGRGMGNDD